MDINNKHWMDYTISLSRKSPKSSVRVGAALVSKSDCMICSAYSGEENNASWSTTLLSKAKKLKISRAHCIYVTVNTMSSPNLFDLAGILEAIDITDAYIGLPDPSLTYYEANDPFVSSSNIHRYPDNLQREILECNEHFFSNSRQNIKNSRYYLENRISNTVVETLRINNIIVSKDDVAANKSEDALAALISEKYGREYLEAFEIAHNVISDAFNQKYSGYDYSYDTRSIDLSWHETFLTICSSVVNLPLSKANILNVGVGGGTEAAVLFKDCKHITFVDIAPTGLEKVQMQIPLAKVAVTSADNLCFAPENTFDLYVSLRTYNSAFFEIEKAVSEAYRILKHNSGIVISVANGFLDLERNCIISGLLIPGTNFVDIYRSMDTANFIYNTLLHCGFKNVGITPTCSEIYISGTK